MASAAPITELHEHGATWHQTNPLRGHADTVKDLADLLADHARNPATSKLAAVPSLGSARIAKLSAALLSWTTAWADQLEHEIASLRSELVGMEDMAIRTRDFNERQFATLHGMILKAIGMEETGAWPGNAAAAQALGKLADVRCLEDPQPRVVCVCGSMRFMDAMLAAAAEESLAGRIVLMPLVNMKIPSPRWATTEQRHEIKANLDQLHFAKIDRADEVLVVNPGQYIGESTQREIAYAASHGKPVRYLESQPGDEQHTPLRDVANTSSRR